MKLDGRDERLLALIGTQPRLAVELAAGSDASPDEVAPRLGALADNGLARELADGRYERTESGRRVLVTSASVPADERIDTTPAVERALDEFDLRPDEADAVRQSFAFVRYWGVVTGAEIVDAVYDEVPAGRETPARWWEEVVREPLAALPGVVAPTAADERWRCAGSPESAATFADGRRVLSRTHPVYGDVKHALESLDLTAAERDAARAAFENLYRRGEVTQSDLREAVFPEHAAGYDDPRAWWDDVAEPAFEALPRVNRTSEGAWRYRRQ